MIAAGGMAAITTMSFMYAYVFGFKAYITSVVCFCHLGAALKNLEGHLEIKAVTLQLTFLTCWSN